MDMTTVGTTSGSSTMGPMPVHIPMWTYFHTVPNDRVLFKFWTVTSVADLLIACAIFFASSVGLELLKYIRAQIDVYAEEMSSATYTSRLLTVNHLVQTILFIIQTALSYLLMLVFMTFNVWLGLSITLGLATGYYFFGARQVAKIGGPVLIGHTTHG